LCVCVGWGWGWGGGEVDKFVEVGQKSRTIPPQALTLKVVLAIWLDLGKSEAKFRKKRLDLGKFDWVWAKSKSCIHKNL